MSEEKYFLINGAKIRYAEHGMGERTVVFAHAGIADSRMWNNQVNEFSKHYRVITYDMRGYGSSPVVVGEFSHHDDLIVLLNELAIENCVMVGCSKGGGVVIDAALSVPDRVLGLVVVAGIAHGLEVNEEYEDPFQWEAYVKAHKESDIEAINELEVQMFVDGYNHPVGRADAAIRDQVREMNLIALTNEANPLENTELVLEPKAATRLSELTMPCLFITTTLDEPITWLAVEKMLPTIPNAEHKIMENVAHLPNMEAPTEFNNIVSSFIKNIQNG